MSVTLAPPPFLQFLNPNNSGSPAVAFQIFTYQAGTNIKQATWTDSTQTVQNPNPLPLDGNGVGTFWGDPTLAYKLVWAPANDTDPPSSPIRTVDNFYFPATIGALVATTSAPILASYARSAAEISAGVTPVNYSYAPGVIDRYGTNTTPGTTDMAPALQSAALVGAQGVLIQGLPGSSYKFASDIPIGTVFRFNGNGCTLLPSGTSRFISSDTTAAASSTISSGGTQGSVSIVVASGTGFAIGQIVRLTNTPFPTMWTKLKNVSGTTLTLQNPCPFDYSGTTTVSAYTVSSLNQNAVIENAKFDGTLTTGPAASTGNPFRLGYYRDLTFRNCEFLNFSCTSFMPLIQVYNCIEVLLQGNKYHDNNLQGSTDAVDVQDSNQVIQSSNFWDDTGFGTDMIRCYQAIAANNILRGTRTWEISQSVQYSVRGIKMTTCGTAQMIGNSADDFSNPFRVDAGFRTIIIGNSSRNAGWSATNTTDVVINISASSSASMYGSIIAHNVIENCGGIAMQVNNGVAAGNARAMITANYIRKSNSYAMFIGNSNDVIITNNIIEDWNTANIGAQAISYGNGATITGNRFFNSNSSSYICLNTNLVSTYLYDFRDNCSPTGNPLFASSLNVEASGTNFIGSGLTSRTVNHGLIRTPSADEIFCNPTATTTNAPGLLWVDTIGATQFNFNCKSDPGGSNLNFAWKASLKMPFTA